MRPELYRSPELLPAWIQPSCSRWYVLTGICILREHELLGSAWEDLDEKAVTHNSPHNPQIKTHKRLVLFMLMLCRCLPRDFSGVELRYCIKVTSCGCVVFSPTSEGWIQIAGASAVKPHLKELVGMLYWHQLFINVIVLCSGGFWESFIMHTDCRVITLILELIWLD